MANPKLVGQNYITPDMVAKVTGRAKYAEDFRADGMLFARQLLSPLPHARIRRLDTSAALALPGVKAIVTADDLPEAGGRHDRSRPGGRRTIRTTSVPSPTSRCTKASRFSPSPRSTNPPPPKRSSGSWSSTSRCRFVIDPLGQPAAWRSQRAHRRQRLAAEARRQRRQSIRAGRRRRAESGPTPTSPRPARARCRWASRPTSGSTATSMQGLPPRRSCSTKPSPRRTSAIRRSSRAPRWPTGRTASSSCTVSTQSTAQTVPAVAQLVGIDPTDVVVISEYTGGGFGSKITGDVSMVIPALLSKKANAPGHDAHLAGRGALHGRRAAGAGRPREGRIHQGRQADGARSLRGLRQRTVRNPGRRGHQRADHVAPLPGAGDAVPQRLGAHQHAAARLAESARRHAGHHDHRADARQGGAAAQHRSGGDPARSTRRRARRPPGRPDPRRRAVCGRPAP